MRHKDPEMLIKIEEYVNEYCSKYGKAPSISMVAEAVGLTKAGAFNYLNKLVDEGRLTKENNSFISNSLYQSEDTTEVAILGHIPCGPLENIKEHADGYMRLPKSLTGKGKHYILKASGNSMIDAGISDGDLVLIRYTKEAKDNDIIVALVNNEVTLKRLKYDCFKNVYYLHPENRNMENIYVDNISIQGIATKVIKDLK